MLLKWGHTYEDPKSVEDKVPNENINVRNKVFPVSPISLFFSIFSCCTAQFAVLVPWKACHMWNDQSPYEQGQTTNPQILVRPVWRKLLENKGMPSTQPCVSAPATPEKKVLGLLGTATLPLVFPLDFPWKCACCHWRELVPSPHQT